MTAIASVVIVVVINAGASVRAEEGDRLAVSVGCALTQQELLQPIAVQNNGQLVMVVEVDHRVLQHRNTHANLKQQMMSGRAGKGRN